MKPKKAKAIHYTEEPSVHYVSTNTAGFAFPVQFKVLRQLDASRGSAALLKALSQKTALSQKALAEYVFEVTPKTISTYHLPGKEFSSQAVELIVKLLELYESAIEVFESAPAFNRWAERPNAVLFGRAPITFFCTVTGIELVYEEVQRIAEGMPA
jgi:uncharacterized protein (DUF2384 family)